MQRSVSDIATLALLAAVLGACDDPFIAEDTPVACTNGFDDDDDGDVDCDDEDCSVICGGISTAENTVAACRNRVDDDGNGVADCLDASCRGVTGACDAFDSPCDTVGQTGCPVGMNCIARPQGTTSCVLAGSGRTTDDCGGLDSEPRCAVGFTCSDAFLVCLRSCLNDADCARDEICLFDGSANQSFCGWPCNPFDLNCPDDLICTPFGVLDETFYDGGGASHVCLVPTSLVTRGEAEAGEFCVDGPADDEDVNFVCENDYVCVPDSVGDGTCRDTCLLSPSGQVLVSCPPSQTCERPYPLDDRPAGLDPNVLGVCQ